MRVLVTGASGQLGGYVLRELQRRNEDVVAWSFTRSGELFGFPLRPVDLRQRDALALAFRQARPDAVLHLAALCVVGDCHDDPEKARGINSAGTTLIAELASGVGARLVYVSTDMVFDGSKGQYGEYDATMPLSVYGRSKLAGEAPVLAAPRGVVGRLSFTFSPTAIGKPGFFDHQLRKMREGQQTTWFEDEWRTPLSLQTAAHALLTLAESDITGILHLGGPERLSRLQMGQRLATMYGLDPALVAPIKQASVVTPEPRPQDLSLDSSKWRGLFLGASLSPWDKVLTG